MSSVRRFIMALLEKEVLDEVEILLTEAVRSRDGLYIELCLSCAVEVAKTEMRDFDPGPDGPGIPLMNLEFYLARKDPARFRRILGI